MIGIIDWAMLVVSSLILWPLSFLLHDWMHIKSQGLFMKGTINVHELGMTCSAETVHNRFLSGISGGTYSGILFIMLGLFAWYYGAWALYVPMITLGVVNFCYGIWEGYKGSTGRWMVYGASLATMVILWLIHYIWVI